MKLCSPCAQGAPGITQSDNVHGDAGEHRMHTAYVRSWFHVELKGIERENIMILAKDLFGRIKPLSQFPWDVQVSGSCETPHNSGHVHGGGSAAPTHLPVTTAQD